MMGYYECPEAKYKLSGREEDDGFQLVQMTKNTFRRIVGMLEGSKASSEQSL